MAHNKKQLIFSLLCVIVIMIIIYNFSAQNGIDSSGISKKISRLICRVIFFNYENMSGEQQMFVVNELHYFIRKLAHFSIYMLLGMFSYMALIPFKQELKKPAVISLAVCAVYAVFDEIHQRFIPGRSMRVTDMVLDTFGAFIGIVIVAVIVIVFGHIREGLKRGK